MKFTNTQFAQDYERRMSAEGYPGELVEIIYSMLCGCRNIIDIGAGCGHFAIPLAQKGYHVITIEPSAAMVKIFKEKIRLCDFEKRIQINQCRWEEWEGQSHLVLDKEVTAALCAYAIYGITDIQNSIEKMLQYSRITLILLGDDSTSITLSGIIRKYLALTPCTHKSSEKIASALKALNVVYTKRTIAITRRTIFNDLDEESEYYMRHLGLKEHYKSRIIQILRQVCSHSLHDHNYFSNGSTALTPSGSCSGLPNKPGKPVYFFDNIYRDIMFVIKK